MVFLLKSIALLAQFSLSWSLAPGDCAFVGIYGEKKDFAILLMEDADGEQISLTDGNFKDKDFESSQRARAQDHVKDAVKGTVLRKSDFQTDNGWSFVAPLALTVYKGSPSSPTPLCGVSLDGKADKVMVRRLHDQVAALNLGETGTQHLMNWLEMMEFANSRVLPQPPQPPQPPPRPQPPRRQRQ
ncbi:unnamed protein product [Durusdinium trenchii]|uniref:Uncharacterized protein n=1 Tax=Durusdinium trenchii TaxID=1381693 RepID=A0ABP0MJF1_9DINO